MVHSEDVVHSEDIVRSQDTVHSEDLVHSIDIMLFESTLNVYNYKLKRLFFVQTTVTTGSIKNLKLM